jgi:hypothetical protein
MFASACRIFDGYNDKDLRRIRQTVRESCSWSRQMKSGRHLSRVVAAGPEPGPGPQKTAKGRPPGILEREARLQAGGGEAALRLCGRWESRFAGCGAELGSDRLRRSLQAGSRRRPRVFGELERALSTVSTGRPLVSEAVLQNLPLTEAEIRRQAREKYEKVGRKELQDFLADCHAKALREKNHIKINWKLAEVSKVKEDTFLQKLHIQSSRYHRPPKEPFIADPRKPKSFRGLRVEWRSKPSLLQTFRSAACRRPIPMDGRAAASGEPQPSRIRLQPPRERSESEPGAPASRPALAAEPEKQQTAKTGSTSLNPATFTLSVPFAGSVREFSLHHLLDGQLPRKSFLFDPSAGPLPPANERPNRSRMASCRRKSSRSASLAGAPARQPGN